MVDLIILDLVCYHFTVPSCFVIILLYHTVTSSALPIKFIIHSNKDYHSVILYLKFNSSGVNSYMPNHVDQCSDYIILVTMLGSKGQ